MRWFDGMVGRAAAVVGVAAAVVVAASARPTAAQVVVTRPTGDVKQQVEKVAAPGPAPVGVVGKVVVKSVTVEKAAVKAFVVGQAGDAPPPPAVPNAEAMVQARVQQLKPILRDELRVLTSAAGPTPEQRRAIALAGGRKLRELAKTPENNRPRVNLFGKRILPNDPAKLVHDAVEAAAREALTPDQFARLQAEARARADDRREAVLMVIVAKLDRTLDLGRDQRDKILDGLRAIYDETTFPTPAMLAQWGENYLPALTPESTITNHLGPEQQAIWSHAQKLDFRSVTMIFNAEVEPPGAADPDLEAALAEEPKP